MSTYAAYLWKRVRVFILGSRFWPSLRGIFRVLLRKVWVTYSRKVYDKVSSNCHPNDLQHVVIQMNHAISSALDGLELDFILLQFINGDGEIVLNGERNPHLYFKMVENCDGEKNTSGVL